MATAKFYIRDGTLKNLPLGLISEVKYADFHKRSETPYSDVPITAADLPFTTLTKRDGTVVDLGSTIVTGFSTDTILVNESDTQQTIPDVDGNPTQVKIFPVTPGRYINDDRRYDINTLINFDNAQGSSTCITHVSGELPDGICITTGITSEGYVTFCGNIRDDLFNLTMNDYDEMNRNIYENQQTSFLNIQYLDNLTDKNVLSNPSSTFSANDIITNVDGGSCDLRKINTITTYDTNKLCIDVDTYTKNVDNYGGDAYVTTYKPFEVEHQQKVDSNGNFLPIESGWRGYLSNAEKTIFAQYETLNHVNSFVDSKFYRDYTFTLALYDVDTNVEVENKTFTLQVQASPEALRDNYLSGNNLGIDGLQSFQDYVGNIRL